jgi:nitrite reductase (cytochrome c-552)
VKNRGIALTREKLISDVYSRQDKIMENRKILENLLVRCHVEAGAAWQKGATEEQMKDILSEIRKAQWRWDFAAAGHGNSFHSPVETGRIVSGGIAHAEEARVRLARLLASLGENREIPFPDISTKTRAQEYIGLNLDQMNKEIDEFLRTVVPEWIKQGKQREDKYQGN